MSKSVEIRNLQQFLQVMRRIVFATPLGSVIGAFTGRVASMASVTAPILTGRLRSSISSWGPIGNRYYVGASVYYAKFLEYGTRKMTARPFLQPAMRAHIGSLEQDLVTQTKAYMDNEIAQGGIG